MCPIFNGVVVHIAEMSLTTGVTREMHVASPSQSDGAEIDLSPEETERRRRESKEKFGVLCFGPGLDANTYNGNVEVFLYRTEPHVHIAKYITAAV